MTKLRFTAIAALACILFNSCLKSSFYYTNYPTFANVIKDDATKLAGDGGVTYIVTENVSAKDFKDCDRIFINCDLLNYMGEDYTQDIKLNDFYPVTLLKGLLEQEQTISKKDPLEILSKSWTSNKNEAGEFKAQYFNLLVQYKGIKGNKAEHKFELVYEPETEKPDEHFFYLYHDASDDICTEETPEANIEVKNGYLSFRVEDIINDVIKYDPSKNHKIGIYPACDKEKPSQSAQSLSFLKME